MDYVEPPQRSWWGRNWKWVVPLGCLSPLIVVGGCVAALYFVFTGWIESSEAYTDSFAAVARDPQVQAALGDPITAGRITSGNLSFTNDSGSADFTYRIDGPKDNASVHVVANRKADVWTVKTNHVVINSTNEELDVPVTPPIP